MAEAAAAAPRPKTVYTSVEMEDGTKVEFPGDQRISTRAGSTPDIVEFLFRSGQILIASTNDGNLTQEYAVHGITQKLRDEAAGLKDAKDAYEAVRALHERLKAGQWSIKREGTGFAGQSVLVQAMVKAYAGTKTADDVRAFLANVTQAEKLKLRGHPKIKPFVDELEKERADKSDARSADELLKGWQ